MTVSGIREAQDRMVKKHWGVFHHYLWNPKAMPDSAQNDWIANIESFDTKKLAKTLHEIGAGYYFITMAHGTEYLLAPNATYESILGIQPNTLCPKYDLVLEIYNALSEYDIDLYLYFNASTPLFRSVSPEYNRKFDRETGEAPKNVNITHYASDGYVEKWAAVLEEYAVRYKDKVKGWWFDSCYTYYGYSHKMLTPFYRAAKKGNPNCLTAFNNGVKEGIEKWYPEEEMICGERNRFDFVPETRFIDGAQSHLLIPLGYVPGKPGIGGWGRKNIQCSAAFLREYMGRLISVGCPLTIDVYNGPDGTLDPHQKEILYAMKE